MKHCEVPIPYFRTLTLAPHHAPALCIVFIPTEPVCIGVGAGVSTTHLIWCSCRSSDNEKQAGSRSVRIYETFFRSSCLRHYEGSYSILQLIGATYTRANIWGGWLSPVNSHMGMLIFVRYLWR